MLYSEDSPKDAFRDSLKLLEADIEHANTLLAGELTRDYDGAYLQMRVSYSPMASLLLVFLRWSDCTLVGALGLMRLLIYKVYKDGTSTMAVHERRASIREFYGFIYPALQQLQPGISEYEFTRQRQECREKYSKKWRGMEESGRGRMKSVAEREVEKECGICLEEFTQQMVLPGCMHSMCGKCFEEWRLRSQSCPFCREELAKVEAEDLWVLVDEREVTDMRKIVKDNLRRFFLYIHRLPIVFSDGFFSLYDSSI